MDDREVLRNRIDLEMMRRVHLWPGETLCLKNYALAEDGWPLFALMVFDPESGLYYFWIREREKERRVGDDTLLRALIAEGWVVD
jgi:hypothetical protein